MPSNDQPAATSLVATRDRLVAERDTLAEAMRLLDLAIGGHTRGCDAPDDPDCPRCVWDSEWARYREVRDV